MKKNAIIIAVAALGGLALGYLLFSNGEAPENPDRAVVEESHEHETFWTCSMHPQIMQPEPGSCPICGMDLIPAETGDQSLAPDQFRMTENAMALADIRTLRVGEGPSDADGMVRLSGEIKPNASTEAVQASYFDGRIEELFVTYPGQSVSRGQRLATLYAPGLVAAQQELLTAAPLKQEQPELYRAVRNKLRNWKLTDAQMDQIEASGKVREAFPVFATVSGTVTEVLAASGDYVKAGQPIARLSNLATVWVELDAYERQMDRFRVGQPVQIQTDARPGSTFEARISFIDPILDTRSRTVTVRATLENPQGLFKPGMFVTGNVDTGESTGAQGLTIPASAVLWTGERSLVYVKPRPDQPVFEMREVYLGERIGEHYAIVKGLAGGEEIVAHGAFTVDAAAQLQGKKSMMNQDSGPGQMRMPMAGDTPWPNGLQQAYPGLLDAYLALKDALVGSDAPGAIAAGRKMQESLPQPAAGWPQAYVSAVEGINTRLGRLVQADAALDRQRAEFQEVSGLLIGLGGAMGSAEAPIYVQFCPMADDFKGAFWISRDAEIRNPYFGDAMLTCGEVRETWAGTSE
ncbi:efflux RND transporter periplasmic adaptor subunit [Robiginitalea sp. M366]|uniref:efflux RND transporter periplasmic adaptor subunit n=1 Tax=Robiginitalea aestuariiviva TaxID=3036903 RepID=UPI00240D535A|nr:efflux RND transporter periplasmic adaptor subunit [Robiginitalea aestuariiviva]MDG1573385.1 efflux RND transporter periplasmic adaptor subunit [Robiginitalea aestuariiviva]